MADKKGKSNSSSSSSSSSNTFMSSFRFSPESESIEEIREIKPNGNSDTTSSSSSTPSSPKPSSGDVSPLKEYLRKEKHKWTNKWDKKSLSLDLDFKGKFKSALEDKTKSILSNFIPEETTGGIIHTSQSIPENLVRTTTFPTPSSASSYSLEEHSSSSSGSGKGTKNSSSGNASQETLDGEDNNSSSDIFKTASLSKLNLPTTNNPTLGDEQFVEEVGVDMTEDFDPNSSDHSTGVGGAARLDDLLLVGSDAESIMDKMMTFNVPGEDLQEYFDGLPTLYQPIALISGIRITPLDLVGDDGITDEASETSIGGRDAAGSEPIQTTHGITVHPNDVRLSTLLINVLSSIVYHPWSKYWVALAASMYLLPFGPFAPMMWFLLGALFIIVINRGLSQAENEDVTERGSEQEPRQNLTEALATYTINNAPVWGKELKFPPRSQGWMTQLVEGDYNPDTCHFRLTKTVFVKIDGSSLYISYPNSRNSTRIPKRRMWNDSVITATHLFDRIKVYNISNASVGIVPDGLSKKRVWNKKYPIVITLPNHSICHDLTDTASTESYLNKRGEGGNNTSVNYNADTADVSVNTERSKPPTGEVRRKDCSFETIYLFARCDREKDDWFRRFVAASKTGTEVYSYLHASPLNPLKEFRDYMRRMCPSLIPFASHNTTSDGFDNVSLPGDISESKRPPPPPKEASSPGSSKKTTPERDISDLENILTIPQSPAFLNAIVGRLFYDFLRSAHWKGEVKKLIDKKLFYMKKPAFIEGIHVKELTLGDTIPVILRASPPVLDHQGLWVDLDLTYESNFCVSLETHVNFLKMVLKKGEPEHRGGGPSDSIPGGSGGGGNGGASANNDHASTSSSNRRSDNGTQIHPASASYREPSTEQGGSSPRSDRSSRGGEASSPTRDDRGSLRASHIYDSDADDSGESSDDDDNELNNIITASPNAPDSTVDPNQQQSKSSKFLEKLANSSLMNRGLVKKIVNNVAATPIVLAVELKGLFGTLTINMPGPPNDRVWLGFRTNPDLQIVAKPLKFGDTNINISQVTTWIKAKILLEFQRAVVCPNMVDITIPLMEFGIPR